MAGRKKSWQEKLEDDKDLPKIVTVEEGGRFGPRWGLKPGDTLVIPAPREVDELMRMVPPGLVVTINEIRDALARRYGTTAACPITTGIFARIAAEATVEAAGEGGEIRNPYWRTLKAGGVINEKYPGGVELQRELLEKEGHKVERRGKKYVVVDYRERLFTF